MSGPVEGIHFFRDKQGVCHPLYPKLKGTVMQRIDDDSILDGREGSKLEVLKLALRDARHVFHTYKDKCPQEAWETLRKIIFDPKLK